MTAHCPPLAGAGCSTSLKGREGVDQVLIIHYLLSFACAKESNKEKHTGNDVRPLPDALIELQCYC